MSGTGFRNIGGVGAAPTQSFDISSNGQLNTDLTSIWLVIAGCMVFFMQCGFALLEAGGVRQKNTANIMLKNTVNTCLTAICWYILGQGFSYGSCTRGKNPFIGLSNFALSHESTNPLAYISWFFSFVFAAVSVTIPSGALAERCQLRAYVVYTIVQSSWTYAIVVHWVWSHAGWLSPFRQSCTTLTLDLTFPKSFGLIDYAGSGNVHMTGGGAALVGAWILGPRLGRFGPNGQIFRMEGCNTSNKVLGCMILWFGWYFFNAGSTGCLYNCAYAETLIVVNTTLSASAAALTVLLLETWRGAPGNIEQVLNGVLAGLVGITSACSVVLPYGALCIGVVSGGVYVVAAILVKSLRIDDPLDSSAVHYFCGCWGVLAPGFFAVPSLMNLAYRQNRTGNEFGGVFYGGSGVQLGVQVLGIVAISAWTLSINFLVFMGLRKIGWLRVSRESEEQGLDFSQSVGTGEMALPSTRLLQKIGLNCF